jgi:hypothetical protein
VVITINTQFLMTLLAFSCQKFTFFRFASDTITDFSYGCSLCFHTLQFSYHEYLSIFITFFAINGTLIVNKEFHVLTKGFDAMRNKVPFKTDISNRIVSVINEVTEIKPMHLVSPCIAWIYIPHRVLGEIIITKLFKCQFSSHEDCNGFT